MKRNAQKVAAFALTYSGKQTDFMVVDDLMTLLPTRPVHVKPFVGRPVPPVWERSSINGGEMYRDAQDKARKALPERATAAQVLKATAGMVTMRTARDTLVQEIIRRSGEYLDLALAEALERRGLVFETALPRLKLCRAPEVDTLLLDGKPILRVVMRFEADAFSMSREHL